MFRGPAEPIIPDGFSARELILNREATGNE